LESRGLCQSRHQDHSPLDDRLAHDSQIPTYASQTASTKPKQQACVDPLDVSFLPNVESSYA
jgi:hypothetical protein